MLADFMAASAAKDCSLLVSIAPTQSAGVQAVGWQGETLRDSSGEDWAVAVHVIDLGPKPLSKIAFWAEQDRKLADDARSMRAYLRGR